MKKLLLILSMLILVSCRKEVDWPLDGVPAMNPVIECMITNEQKAHEVIVSLPVSQLNDNPQPVGGATVTLTDGNSVYCFTEDFSNPGHYFSDSTLAGIPGHHYVLSVKSDSTLYEASYTMIPGELFQPLTYTSAGADGWYKISNIAPLYDADEYAIYEVLIDWSLLPGYDTLEYQKTHARVLGYTLPTIDVNEILPSGTENVYFPRGAVITMRRYSISYQHALFLRALLTETSWNGGFFDTRSGNVKGNFNHDAYGYFSACGVTWLTFVVE